VVQSYKVLGTTQDLHDLVRSLKIDHVVITIAHAARHQIHRIVKLCEEIPVRVRIIPELYEIIEGRVEISRIRDVQIEDLLGRDRCNWISKQFKRSFGKTVMVTGPEARSVRNSRQVLNVSLPRSCCWSGALNSLFLMSIMS
jgi:FlaA1/EpsC-like NDP-sugar epimerase